MMFPQTSIRTKIWTLVTVIVAAIAVVLWQRHARVSFPDRDGLSTHDRDSLIVHDQHITMQRSSTEIVVDAVQIAKDGWVTISIPGNAGEKLGYIGVTKGKHEKIRIPIPRPEHPTYQLVARLLYDEKPFIYENDSTHDQNVIAALPPAPSPNDPIVAEQFFAVEGLKPRQAVYLHFQPRDIVVSAGTIVEAIVTLKTNGWNPIGLEVPFRIEQAQYPQDPSNEIMLEKVEPAFISPDIDVDTVEDAEYNEPGWKRIRILNLNRRPFAEGIVMRIKLRIARRAHANDQYVLRLRNGNANDSTGEPLVVESDVLRLTIDKKGTL